jgi:micrococcal nuclease
MTTRLLKKPTQDLNLRLNLALRDYAVLKARVHEVLILGRKRMEQEFMRMRYDTGLLINEHVRLNGDRADYGAKAVLKLEKDFDIDHTELNRYAQFARSYRIGGDRRQLELNLPWMSYRKLMIVQNAEQRWALTLEAEKNEWPFEKIEARVRYATGKDNDEKKPPRLPLVCLGPFYTYKINPSEGSSKELFVDLGFGHELEMSLFKTAAPFPAETIVTSSGEIGRLLRKVDGATEEVLYTFKAAVLNILDADTLKLRFLLGHGNRHRETIRLNHINCPELDTPEGRAAKRFIESELAGCDFITVKSVRTKKEKWGRYLGDVFYARKNKGPLIYLNQLLLDKGHAVLFKA